MRFGGTRFAVMAAVVALAVVRLWINPPLSPLLYWLVPTWYLVTAVYYVIHPKEEAPTWFRFLLRYTFFLYEVVALAVIFCFLGGSGWLSILFLLLPALELNLAFGGAAAALGSIFGAVAVGAVALAESRGWLWHDPFYSVSAPLYREPAYVAAVFVVALVFLVALPAWTGHYGRSRS